MTMETMENKTTRVQIRVGEKLLAQIDKEIRLRRAQGEELNRSSFCRRAIVEWLSAKG
jgi:predicted DNA-binding ribbon-helix-helix protein